MDTSRERLDQIVHRKAKWILDRRQRLEDIPPAPSSREFVSGEAFRYLGRQYRLKVDRRRRAEGPRTRLQAGNLQVVGVPHSKDVSIDRELRRWYRHQTERRIPERVEFWAEHMRLQPSAVLIREQKKRWGSADAQGNLRFNWRIIQAPLRLIDYVVAHELVHLVHPDHTRDFWALLGRHQEDYEARREALRHLGPQLVW